MLRAQGFPKEPGNPAAALVAVLCDFLLNATKAEKLKMACMASVLKNSSVGGHRVQCLFFNLMERDWSLTVGEIGVAFAKEMCECTQVFECPASTQRGGVGICSVQPEDLVRSEGGVDVE